jgi:alpha-N-arabinofuranosidase
MDLISEHFYEGRVPWNSREKTSLSEHVSLLKNSIRKKAEGHRKLQAELPNLNGRIIPIAMDEWNYWHRKYVYGELGCVYDLADGLGVAAGLHEYFRQSDLIRMAHYAQTVNVIGAIKTTRPAAEMETTGLVLQLYRNRFGQVPLRVEQDAPGCDLAAALTRDGKTLTLAIMNPTESEVDLRLSLSGASAAAACTGWHITGPSPDAHNSPGELRRMDIRETGGIATSASLRAPPFSASVFSVPLRRPTR